jgi:hypothetical protein
MQSSDHSNSIERQPPAGVFRRLINRPCRLFVPPLILCSLAISMATLLLTDLRQLSEDDLALVEQAQPAIERDGNLIISVKNINPNNGVATLDVTYVTDDLEKGKVEAWIASGSGTLSEGSLVYEANTELHRVPIVMDAPTVFVWGEAKRATYKQQNINIKIDQRVQGYFYPFDRYVVEFSFAVTDKSQTTLCPKLWCELEDPHFVNAAPRSLMSRGDKAVLIPNSLMVVLDRPMYQKTFLGLSALMVLGCVVWALYKITYTPISAMESLSLLAFEFTVLMAVPALRGVLVPPNLQFAPLFDFFIVLIWTVGLLALIVNIVRHDIMVRLEQWAAMDGFAPGTALIDPRTAHGDPIVIPRRAAG